MSNLKKNLIANLTGKSISAILSVIFVPYYVAIIGIESWGLVGFYITLTALLSLLDVGLGTTINREMARLCAQECQPSEARDLTRTLEVIYWATAVCIAFLILSCSSLLATHWIHAETLSKDTIKQAIYCMGFAFAVQWPSNLYAGGLTGLQKQVLLNVINLCVVVVRVFGLIGVLLYISPTIQMFFIWQMGVNLLQTFLTGLFLWKSLPTSKEPTQFDFNILKRLWRFTLGMSGIAILSLILTNLDKVILSKILPLEKFGYYSLAASVVAGLYYITGSVFSAFFPHFSKLVALRRDTETKRHLSSQLSIDVSPDCSSGNNDCIILA